MAKGYRGLPEEHFLLKQLCCDGEFHNIVEKIKSGNKYWLGIRDNKVMLYFMGGKILEVSAMGKLSFDEKYLDGVNRTNIGSTFKTIAHWEQNEKILSDAISKFQKSGHNEKIAQQEIMIENNNAKDSEWFLVDMEYSVPGISYGRFDMIALSKEKDENGKYKIALVELKSGMEAFGGASSIRDNKNNIVGIKSYGSGISGHINNFYEFLYGEKAPKTVENLAQEIVTIVRNYNEIGIQTPYNNIDQDEINTNVDSVECLILCTDIDPTKKDAAYHKARRFIFKGEKGASVLCLESDFCWNKNGLFEQKYDRLKLYISIVDKERVIKRTEFRELKK